MRKDRGQTIKQNEKTGPKRYTAKPPAFAFYLRQKDCGPFACFPCAYFLQEFKTRYFLQILFAPIALFLRALEALAP